MVRSTSLLIGPNPALGSVAQNRPCVPWIHVSIVPGLRNLQIVSDHVIINSAGIHTYLPYLICSTVCEIMVLASDDHYGSEALTECFQYHQRLEEREIRLIQLEIGSRQDEIVVQLSHKRINDDTIKYHALSYVWGSKSDAVTIKCDNRPLLITQNLHKALVQLREDGLRIPIWVDAVCIDQQNLDERARQVRLMRQIYSQAETVHVWIGEETANTEAGVELLHRTAKAVQDLPHDLTAGTSYPELKAMGLPHMFDSTWKAVAEIITRQWFGRVWVIQEMTVARKCIFICGRLKIEYEAVRTLARSLSYFSTLQNTLSINLPHDVSAGFSSFMISVLGLVATEYAESGSLLLRDLLFLTGAFQATEPKDRIFALLGITDDVPQEFINYNRSLREILIDVASMCLTRDRHKTAPPLDVLCFVNHIIQSPDLPSWVPVWDTKGRVFCPLHLILQPKEWIEVREASYSITGEVESSLSLEGIPPMSLDPLKPAHDKDLR